MITMHLQQRAARCCLVVSLGALASSCVHAETRVERTQRVLVESDPPGGTIYVADDSGRERMGVAPATLELAYSAKRVEFDPRCWVFPGVGVLMAGIGAVALNAALDTPAVDNGDVSAGVWVGAFGLGLGGPLALAGLGICLPEALGDPVETPLRGPTGKLARDVEVELPGYPMRKLSVPFSPDEAKLSFRLDAPNDGPAGVATKVAVVAAKVAVDRPSSGGPPLPRPPAPAPPRPSGRFAAGAIQPNAFALVIGVERYRDLPPPTGARADAERFAALATSTLGVPERNLKLALDDRAARSDLEKHLVWLENNVPAEGRIYVFFAGHGAPDPASGTSYLLPYDADPAALPGTALKLSELTERLGRTKARTVVAFLDSCFSGTGGRSVLAAGTRPLVPVQKLVAPAHVSVLAAVSGGQTSGAHAEGGGLFSHYLFEALGEGKADHDGDGQITLGEVKDWLAPRVEREARRDNREQLPSLLVGPGGEGAAATLAIGVSGG